MEEPKQYIVNEIFYSLQGEGFNTGRAAVFVRFAGCNLRCPFCDTDHARGTHMTAAQIVSAVFAKSTDQTTLIVLTGGEPALQVDAALLQALKMYGHQIAIETNGTYPLPQGIDWVTLSPKENSRPVLEEADEVKVVYLGQDVERWRHALKAQHYFLQPCSQQNTEAVVAYILTHPQWRLSLQTHKYVGIR